MEVCKLNLKLNQFTLAKLCCKSCRRRSEDLVNFDVFSGEGSINKAFS